MQEDDEDYAEDAAVWHLSCWVWFYVCLLFLADNVVVLGQTPYSNRKHHLLRLDWKSLVSLNHDVSLPLPPWDQVSSSVALVGAEKWRCVHDY